MVKGYSGKMQRINEALDTGVLTYDAIGREFLSWASSDQIIDLVEGGELLPYVSDDGDEED